MAPWEGYDPQHGTRTPLAHAPKPSPNPVSITRVFASFVFLWQWGGRAVLGWFALPGRMTLTLYVLQSCIMVPLLYGFGFGLWREVTLAQMVWTGIAFFALQIAFAAWWYRRYRYGPLEWVWRAATLTTWHVPMRRSAR